MVKHKTYLGIFTTKRRSSMANSVGVGRIGLPVSASPPAKAMSERRELNPLLPRPERGGLPMTYSPYFLVIGQASLTDDLLSVVRLCIAGRPNAACYRYTTPRVK